eukprot:Ihof_evm2s204 gene=Ihof_evmTU2s204
MSVLMHVGGTVAVAAFIFWCMTRTKKRNLAKKKKKSKSKTSKTALTDTNENRIPLANTDTRSHNKVEDKDTIETNPVTKKKSKAKQYVPFKESSAPEPEVKEEKESSSFSYAQAINKDVVDLGKETQRNEQEHKAKFTEAKGVAMTVDTDSDDELKGDILLLKKPGPKPKTVKDYARDPADDGWERVVGKQKTATTGPPKPVLAGVGSVPQARDGKKEAISKTEKKNKKRIEKQKAIKEAMTAIQGDRLRQYRQTQPANICTWKPPPPPQSKWTPATS